MNCRCLFIPRETKPEPNITNTVNDLIVKVVKQLAKVRSRTISYLDDKEPSDPFETNR